MKDIKTMSQPWKENERNKNTVSQMISHFRQWMTESLVTAVRESFRVVWGLFEALTRNTCRSGKRPVFRPPCLRLISGFLVHPPDHLEGGTRGRKKCQ